MGIGAVGGESGGGFPDYMEDTPAGTWLPDPLGPGFTYTTLYLGRDQEGPVRATVVRYVQPVPPAPAWRTGLEELAGQVRRLARPGQAEAALPPPAVLYIHGWTDYFYNAELARYWAHRGYRFYALDLRRYGRSLRPWMSPGFVVDLHEYDDDIAGALETIRRDLGGTGDLVCVAHSTGGLTASLWAHRHPGRFKAFVLNSPWLELQGSWLVRYAAAGILEPVARVRPRVRLKLPEVDYYWQSLSRQAHGEWDLHPLWRPRLAFPVTAGWISAVLAGHATVARGLDIQEPVLVLTAGRTHLGTAFDPEMMRTDTVLAVDVVRQRSLKLGRLVTAVRIPDAMHDVFTSSIPVRREAYRAVTRWAEGYLEPPGS